MTAIATQLQNCEFDQVPAQSQAHTRSNRAAKPAARLVTNNPILPLRTILPLKEAVQDAMRRTG